MKKLMSMFKDAGIAVSVETEVTTTGDVDTGTAPIAEDTFAQAITESETSLDSVMDAHDEVQEAHDDFDTVLEASDHIDETFQVAVESIAAGTDYAVVRPMAVANIRYAFRRIGLEGDINSDAAEGESHGTEVPDVDKGEATGVDVTPAADVMGDNSVETPKEAESTPTSALVAEPHVDGVECASGLCPVCGAASIESLGDKAKAFAETVIKALKDAWERVKAFYARVFTHLGRLEALAKSAVAKIEARDDKHATPKVSVSLPAEVGMDVVHAITALIDDAEKMLTSDHVGSALAKHAALKVDTTLKTEEMSNKDVVKDLNAELGLITAIGKIKESLAKVDSGISKMSFNLMKIKVTGVASTYENDAMRERLKSIKEHQARATALTSEVVTNVTKRVHALAKAVK